MQSILVLDDDPGLGEIIAAAAEQMGLRCVFTTDPNAFLQQLTPDITLVMVDLVMPHIDGVEMLRLLAQQGCEANIVVMSGLGKRVIEAAEQVAVSLGLSIIGHLRKPIRLVELENVLITPKRVVPAKQVKLQRQPDLSDQELRDAMERCEFINHYQPQISVASGDVVGVEALSRWLHPVHGLIFPDSFISRLEGLGMITELGWMVSRQAFSDIRRFANDAGICPALAINFSAHTLHDLQFPDSFAALATENGVDAKSVILEITESSVIRDLPATLDVLARLRMKQFELSIDDFGTGYSMMQQLMTIPATELKVDRSFVMNLQNSEQDRVVVNKSIEFGHELGMRVVAEGVETMEQLEFLRAHGCDVAQGYLFSRPQSAAELVVWLQNYRAR